MTALRIKELQAKWRKNNKEKLAKWQARWRAQNPEKYAAQQTRYQDKHRTRIREKHLLKKYGLTETEYQAMLERQQSRCAVCERKFDLMSRKKTNETPCVDHCHISGKNRSLLCQPCNLLLGNCLENPKILLSAIQYLSEH